MDFFGLKREVLIILYDTAGNYRYKLLTNAHYSIFVGFIFVFDYRNKESLEEIENEIDYIKKRFNKKIIGVIICNKYDSSSTFIQKKRTQDYISEKFYHKQAGLEYFEVSILDPESKLDYSLILEKIVRNVYKEYKEEELLDYELDDDQNNFCCNLTN